MSGFIPFTLKDWKKTYSDIRSNLLWHLLTRKRINKKITWTPDIAEKTSSYGIKYIICGAVIAALIVYIQKTDVRYYANDLLKFITLLSVGMFPAYPLLYTYRFSIKLKNIVKSMRGEELALVPWNGHEIFMGLIMAPSVYVNSIKIGLLIPIYQLCLMISANHVNYSSEGSAMQAFIAPILLAINFLMLIFSSFLFSLRTSMIIIVHTLGIKSEQWAKLPRYSMGRYWFYLLCLSSWILILMGITGQYVCLYYSLLLFTIMIIIVKKNLEFNYQILIRILPEIFKNFLVQNSDSLREPGCIYPQKDRGIFVVKPGVRFLYKILTPGYLAIPLSLAIAIFIKKSADRSFMTDLQTLYVIIVPPFFFGIYYILLTLREALLNMIIPKKTIIFQSHQRLTYLTPDSFVLYVLIGICLLSFTPYLHFPLSIPYFSFRGVLYYTGADLFLYLFLFFLFFNYFSYYLFNFIIKKCPVFFTDEGIVVNNEYFCDYNTISSFLIKEEKNQIFLKIYFNTAPGHSSLRLKLRDTQEKNTIMEHLKKKDVREIEDETDAAYDEIDMKTEGKYTPEKVRGLLYLFVLIIFMMECLYFFVLKKAELNYLNFYPYYYSGYEKTSIIHELIIKHREYILFGALFLWITIFSIILESTFLRLFGNWKKIYPVTQTPPSVKPEKIL